MACGWWMSFPPFSRFAVLGQISSTNSLLAMFLALSKFWYSHEKNRQNHYFPGTGIELERWRQKQNASTFIKERTINSMEIIMQGRAKDYVWTYVWGCSILNKFVRGGLGWYQCRWWEKQEWIDIEDGTNRISWKIRCVSERNRGVKEDLMILAWAIGKKKFLSAEVWIIRWLWFKPRIVCWGKVSRYV